MTISRRTLLVSALLSAVMLSACGKKKPPRLRQLKHRRPRR